jgi:hypothetical protein
MLNFKWIAASAIALGQLAACGGGGSGVDLGPQFVAGTGVPAGAQTQASAVVAFAKSEIATTSESSDPVVLGDATTLATSDSDEPADI